MQPLTPASGRDRARSARATESPSRDCDPGASAQKSCQHGKAFVFGQGKPTQLAVSKAVQDELATIRADLQTAMIKFTKDRHYGAAERMLVIVDRSLHNLIRDAVVWPEILMGRESE